MTINLGETTESKFNELKQIIFFMHGALEDFGGNFDLLSLTMDKHTQVFQGVNAVDELSGFLSEWYWLRFENAKFVYEMRLKTGNLKS